MTQARAGRAAIIKLTMVDAAGRPPYHRLMEERIQKLEAWAEKTSDRIAAIERALGIIGSNYATKEDLHRELHSLTWKVIGAIAVLCAAVFWMARNVQPTDASHPAEQRVLTPPVIAPPLAAPGPARPSDGKG